MSEDMEVSKDSPQILLVEDDEVDVELLRRAFRRHGLGNELVVVQDGPEALRYLRQRCQGQLNAAPMLVLLDLNLPTMSGLEVLDEVRNDNALRRAVVFILSTSERDKDREMAYDKNVAGYLVKGKGNADLENLCEMIKTYCEVNHFP